MLLTSPTTWIQQGYEMNDEAIIERAKKAWAKDPARPQPSTVWLCRYENGSVHVNLEPWIRATAGELNAF
jgi:hypothetical protein